MRKGKTTGWHSLAAMLCWMKEERTMELEVKVEYSDRHQR